MKNKKKVIGNTVFFFALFGLTAYAVLKGKELSELAEVLKSVKPAYYIAGLVMIVVFVCCESYIIYRMLRLLHYNDVPKRNCVKYSFVGFFFSCITPSATGGQPMQLYYMNRDKVDISVGTVILMIVTILYKFVLVFLGALIFLFRHFLVAEYIGKAAFFFYLGMALNVFCVAFMLILVFEPTLASKIVLWLFQKLEKFHILKKKEERLEKLQNSMIEYHKAAAIIQGHRIFIFRMFVVTLIQRLIHFSITYLVYRAMGLSALGFIDVVALQSVISISVDMLPLPGGMGISEGLFLNIFKKIFVGGLLYPAMLLSRGISYYAALKACVSFKPDLILLDLMLPGMDGYQVCREVRKTSSTPIIMLSAKGEVFDKVLGLELGADDYMIKPFDSKELVARVKAVLRRTTAIPAKSDIPEVNIISYPDLEINMNNYSVNYMGKKVDMPPKEIELLHFLAASPNQVFTREQLLDHIWGYEYAGDTRTVDVHIKRIREKIKDNKDWSLSTVWGIGYKFELKK